MSWSWRSAANAILSLQTKRRTESLLTLMVIPLHTTNCYYITNNPLERYRILFTHFIRDVQKFRSHILPLPEPRLLPLVHIMIVPQHSTFVNSFSCGVAEDIRCGLIKFYLKRRWTWTPLFFSAIYIFHASELGGKSRSTGPK